MTPHLDLDALADVLAGIDHPAHLTECAGCRAALEELRTASAQTTSELAALPQLSMPADIAARLQHALSSAEKPAGATVTTLPSAADRSPRRWLPAAAAVVLLLAGAGYGLSRLGGDRGSNPAASGSAAKAATVPELDPVRNSSGTDYTDRATLAAAVPQLLAGSTASRDTVAGAPAAPLRGAPPNQTAPQSQAVSDPLARLRDNGGLADCLLALLPPGDPSAAPLALDYASYKGAPAMVVVLPGSRPDKLDVFVVGPGCSRANDSTLFYTSVDKP